MPLLELLVLRVVLPRDLFVLLPDNVSLCPAVLVLQCLLVVKLLFDLSLNGGRVHFAEQRNQSFSEEVV